MLLETAFNEVAGIHEDNGGVGVKAADELIVPAILTSLLILGSVDGN